MSTRTSADLASALLALLDDGRAYTPSELAKAAKTSPNAARDQLGALERRGAIVMLKADGRWYNLRSRLRVWRRTAEFFAAIAPGLLRSASPNHDPRDEPDPAWAREWIAGYAQSTDDAPPLVDTNEPDFPVPFPTKAAA